VKRTVRRFHQALSKSIVNSPTTSKEIICQVFKKILLEMKEISSLEHDSILRSTYTVEALKHFEWERVWLELKENLPTLTSLLALIIPHSSEELPLICLAASMLLKSRHQQLGLVQRAVSVMLYAHGTSKEVRFT